MVWPQSYHFVVIVRYGHSKELVIGTMDVVSYINLLFISALIPMSLFLDRLGLLACAYPNIISLAICCVSGLKEQRFRASHSFRIGAATTAAEAGLPPWLIQTLGRWSSNCYTQYIKTPASILQSVPAQLAATHNTPLQSWDPSTGQCRPL